MLSKEVISAEVINLRSIRTLDRAAIKAYVRKTNRLVVLEEGFPSIMLVLRYGSLSLSLHTHHVRFACSDGDFINVASIFLVNLPLPLSGLAYGHWVLIAFMSLVHTEGEDYWSRKPFILLKKLARISTLGFFVVSWFC